MQPFKCPAIHSLWRALVDFVYPACCVLCKASLADDENVVCHVCLDSLPHLLDCRVTGEPFVRQLGDKPWFSASLALFPYNDSMHKLIHLFKYKGYHSLARPLGEELGYFLRETVLPGPVLLVPVPLHKRRLTERGYNQAQLLAEHAAAISGLACDAKLLQRIRYTQPQAKQSKAGRGRNLAGAFNVIWPDALCGVTAILVDDLITTGHTMNECARTLRLAGCPEVICATLVRA